MYVCTIYVPGCQVGQNWELDARELELQAVVSRLMWVLGAELGSSEEQQVLLTTKYLSSP